MIPIDQLKLSNKVYDVFSSIEVAIKLMGVNSANKTLYNGEKGENVTVTFNQESPLILKAPCYNWNYRSSKDRQTFWFLIPLDSEWRIKYPCYYFSKDDLRSEEYVMKNEKQMIKVLRQFLHNL